jgi:hypothetical protein
LDGGNFLLFFLKHLLDGGLGLRELFGGRLGLSLGLGDSFAGGIELLLLLDLSLFPGLLSSFLKRLFFLHLLLGNELSLSLINKFGLLSGVLSLVLLLLTGEGSEVHLLFLIEVLFVFLFLFL